MSYCRCLVLTVHVTSCLTLKVPRLMRLIGPSCVSPRFSFPHYPCILQPFVSLCRDLLHFPAVCSACLISSGVVPVYLVLYFTAVSSKIKACLWVCSGILSCLLHTAIHDPDINKYTDSPSAPFHWSELARCFQKEIQTYVNRLLTTLLTPSLSVLDLSC